MKVYPDLRVYKEILVLPERVALQEEQDARVQLVIQD